MRTGRGSVPSLEHGHIRLRATGGGAYWIACDGAGLSRGHELDAAEELQPGFTEAMARAGEAARR